MEGQRAEGALAPGVGSWALAFSGFNPHFLFFVALGLMSLPLAFRTGMA